ncbi:uncharacterized protein [Rutidosis leptorrhynchoides]|uniref:uncharacterized protein n=1 Tax=Rutidosis leptorrhynchoides TaxID=125765 RepID=UPI003A98EE7F
MVLNCTRRAIFCLVEIISSKEKIYCTFVYACNKGKERVPLWNDLHLQKTVTNKMPWFIMGDFNITRYLNEHSAGCSILSEEMKEFNSCLNDIKIEDINISGFHFTWTKSLKNPRCGTLKKLDRIMINAEVMNAIPQAHCILLPYVISDHSPTILNIPNFIVSKPKSFRFMNYITEKEAFMHIVKEGWNRQYVGCAMYCLIMKLKGLKKDLRKLNWADGNTFNKVKILKMQLKDVQSKIVADPHNVTIRDLASKTLQEYEEAKHDEFLIQQQKTKVKWLGEGDKNTKYFHKNFLGKVDSVIPIEYMGNIFSVTLDSNEANAMVLEVSNSEIKDAIFDIDSEKAAGPDGYTSHFFKKS